MYTYVGIRLFRIWLGTYLFMLRIIIGIVYCLKVLTAQKSYQENVFIKSPRYTTRKKIFQQSVPRKVGSKCTYYMEDCVRINKLFCR